MRTYKNEGQNIREMKKRTFKNKNKLIQKKSVSLMFVNNSSYYNKLY